MRQGKRLDNQPELRASDPIPDSEWERVLNILVANWRRTYWELAEDLAADGMLQCVKAISKYRGDSSAATFFVSVGRNAGLSALRRYKRWGSRDRQAGERLARLVQTRIAGNPFSQQNRLIDALDRQEAEEGEE